MKIVAHITQPKIAAELDFTKIYVGGDNREAKSLLFNWMSNRGYPVTASMTILQLVRVLVGTAVHYFTIVGDTFIEVVSGAARVENDTLEILQGGRFENDTFILER